MHPAKATELWGEMANETVLIIEDDPSMLEGLKDNFEFEGYSVLTAADGEAGLEAALEAEGLAPIAVEPGQPFDPLVHEAITREVHEDFEEDQVIAEVQKGYKLGERVLRPTLVRFSGGPPAEEQVTGDE